MLKTLLIAALASVVAAPAFLMIASVAMYFTGHQESAARLLAFVWSV